MDDLSQDEISVIMQMSGDLGYSASSLSDNLAYEQPLGAWTPRKVNKIQRALRDKDYADFGHLTSEDDNLLMGRGYWLSRKGCDIRYGPKP